MFRLNVFFFNNNKSLQSSLIPIHELMNEKNFILHDKVSELNEEKKILNNDKCYIMKIKNS